MTRAFERALRDNRCAVMIGTDAPALDAALAARAPSALSDADAAFVPSCAEAADLAHLPPGWLP